MIEGNTSTISTSTLCIEGNTPTNETVHYVLKETRLPMKKYTIH